MQEPKRRLTTAFWWLLFIGLFIFLFATHKSNKPDRFFQFASFQYDVSQGNVAHVAVEDNTIAVSLRDGQEYYTLGVVNDSLTSQLSDQGVHVVRDKSSSDWTFIFWIFIVVFAVVVFFVIRARRQNGGMGNWFTFRKTRARLIPDLSKVTFADVGGCDEAKELLQDVVDYLKNPKRWEQAQVRPPRGILLEGPPGCGKTLLARALAGETNSKFYLSPASEFVEMFVGVGAARVRDTFETATKDAPAVVFIDELDAVGRRRGSGIGAGNDEREQTLNQLLLCIEGIEDRKPVVVIAATNRPDILDSALLRPGRFDRRIHIPILSREARIQTLRIHTKGKQLAPTLSLETMADKTAGFSGAQLECLANEAALLALRRTRDAAGQQTDIRIDDFENALRPITGRARKFDKLDQVMIESTTQLAEPTGKAVVRVAMDGEAIEGHLIWADAHFVKISGDKGPAIVAKSQIKRIEALDGTEAADSSEVTPDPWAGRNPGLA